MGNLVVYGLVAMSFFYVIYYMFLVWATIREQSKIIHMYLMSVEKQNPISFPSFQEISFTISLSEYRKAKAYNKQMKEVYESIEKL